MNLLIVESPAKAKTIEGYLSSMPDKWTVLATGGHIIDLPKSRHGIKHDNDRFIAEWELIDQKKEGLKKIIEVAKKATHCFIGSDDDREGEAIASSIIQYAKIEDPIRIAFTEITKKAIIKAISEGARPLDKARVSAQEARRLVDREIGYPVSQIIRWHLKSQQSEHTPKGVGRIISPSLKLIHDNDKTIREFVSIPYSMIYSDYVAYGLQFRLMHKHKFTEDQAHELESMLKWFQSKTHTIYNIKQQTRDVSPYPPLVTSRLQRCAFYLFGMEPKQTMKIAQQLYEGIEINGQREGLISYPRTDSFTLSNQTNTDIIKILSDHYENNYVLSLPREYKNKDTAQAAHEAIHPTHLTKEHYPRELKEYLTKEQFDIYRLIWNRTLATQMTDSVYDNTTLEIDVDGNRMFAQANEQLFDGWEKLAGHEAKISETSEEEGFKSREVKLPTLSIGDEIKPIETSTMDLTTRTPPRYGMGRFITLLDNKGIARPSTIDGILPSLINKGYIKSLKGMLYLTNLGKAVDEWTEENASWLNDIDTAKEFEALLDSVEQSNLNRDEIIGSYVTKVEALKNNLGFIAPQNRAPSKEQIEYAQSISEKVNVPLSEETLNSAIAVSEFIKKHAVKQTKVGKCPTCKGPVIETEKSYRCKEKSCSFYMVKTQVHNFISRFKIETSELDLTKELLKRKKTPCANLPGKNEKRFNAFIGLKNHETYGWQPNIISFAKNIEAPVFTGH